MVNEDLARALELIAKGGAYAFYRGEIAGAIVEAMESIESDYESLRGVLLLFDGDKAGLKAAVRSATTAIRRQRTRRSNCSRPPTA